MAQAMSRLLLLLPIAALLGAAGPPASAELELRIERLRNAKGMIRICLTRQQAHFPDCKSDRLRVLHSVAATSGTIRLPGLVPGAYAVSAFHDENANNKFDTTLAIPREGFAFSRNPAIRFGAPKFRQVVIDLRPGINPQTLRMQYLL